MDTWVNKEHEENSASKLIYLLKLEGRAPREPAAALGAHRPLPHSPDPEQAPSTQHTLDQPSRSMSAHAWDP